MDHIGMDVHKRGSQICILTEAGELIERRVCTEPERFAAVLSGRPRARILLEASTESEWVARCLEALGDEVVAAAPNFAPMYATSIVTIKAFSICPAPGRTRAGDCQAYPSRRQEPLQEHGRC